MRVYNLNVSEMSLSFINSYDDDIVENNIGIVKLHFNIPEDEEEWNTFDKYVVFHKAPSGTPVQVALDEDNTCLVPYEMLKTPGKFRAGVFGKSLHDERLINTNLVSFGVRPGAYEEDPEDPSRTIWDKLFEIVESKGDELFFEDGTLYLKADGKIISSVRIAASVTAEGVSIVDRGGYYDSANVEGALQEIGAELYGAVERINNL